jgi:hypothetical protein
MKRNGSWIAVVALVAWLVLATAAGAAVRLGPDLSTVQNGNAFGCQGGMYSPCSWITYGSSNPGITATSPISGIVTKWRFRAGCCDPVQSESRTMTLKTFAPHASGDGYIHLDPVSTGPSFVIPAGNSVISDPAVELPAHLPIAAGQSIGIVADYPIEFATYSYPSINFTVLFNGFSYGSSYGGAMAISADVEPDADGDGFGDETQDCQPTSASEHEPCAPVFLPPPANPISVGTTGPCASGCSGAGAQTAVVFTRPPQSIPTPRGDGGIVVELECPPGATSPCGGILYAELPTSGGAKPRISAAAPTILARSSYSVKPGKRKSLRLEFPRKAIDFLARKRTRRVIVTIQPKGGQPTSATRTLRYPKPEPSGQH